MSNQQQEYGLLATAGAGPSIVVACELPKLAEEDIDLFFALVWRHHMAFAEDGTAGRSVLRFLRDGIEIITNVHSWMLLL